jgi:hypothetical protein
LSAVSPHLRDPPRLDAVDGEFLRRDRAAGRGRTEELAAVGAGVHEVRRDAVAVDQEVAQVPAVVGERRDDGAQAGDVRLEPLLPS